jgi:hypothetical protein
MCEMPEREYGPVHSAIASAAIGFVGWWAVLAVVWALYAFLWYFALLFIPVGVGMIGIACGVAETGRNARLAAFLGGALGLTLAVGVWELASGSWSRLDAASVQLAVPMLAAPFAVGFAVAVAPAAIAYLLRH